MVGSTIPRKESVESSQEQRPRTMQDAYMEVSGRATQEIKPSYYRGAITENHVGNSDRDRGFWFKR